MKEELKIENEDLFREIRRATEYIAIGCKYLFNDENIDKDSVEYKVKGTHFLWSGANILNSLSKIKCKDGEEHFPVDTPSILGLVMNSSFDEWVERYPFLKGACNDLVDSRVNFYDQTYSDEEFNSKEDNEFNLYVKLNNDLAFSEVREMARNDSEYTFSRAYIPPVLEGDIVGLKQYLHFLFVSLNGENANDSFINKILINYYNPINSLNKYHNVNGQYALCKNCGSLMRKRKDERIICTFSKCENSHYKKNKKCEIGGYSANPTMTLKYEIMRYIYYPAIEERLIFDKLNAKYQKKGKIRDLVLYKNKDMCDISFYIKNSRLAIDIKEWESPSQLGKALSEDNFKRNNRDAECIIVIPDYLTKKSNGRKNNYMARLNSAITGEKMLGVKICTEKEFFKYLDDCIKE